jgi:magnesium transporter
MVDSLIAGIYGMNFINIPELKLPYGYFAALILMAILSVLLILVFRRMKWL